MLYTERVALVFSFYFVCTLSFVYFLLIAVNFAEMFHKNLAELQRKRMIDGRVQALCKEQDFGHHIRHHIDICDTVELDSLTNMYQSAMQLALDGLHLCGSYSCENIIIPLTQFFRLSIYTWIAIIVVILI